MDLKNHSLIKRVNRVKILDVIRKNSPIARAQIADIAGLDRKTLTNFINELIDEGLVEEAGKLEMPQGRPYTMLRFKKHLVTGISIHPGSVCASIMDFYGNIQDFHKLEYNTDSLSDLKNTVDTIYKKIKSLHPELYPGTGLSVPGILDVNSGILKYSANMPCLKGVNIKEAFQNLVGAPLFIEKDTNSMALSEKWFGAGKKSGDFVYMDISTGIGLGIVINRSIYRGAGGYAGELGHVIVEQNGKKCSCGKQGCLEAYSSEWSLLSEINKKLALDIHHLKELPPDAADKIKDIVNNAGTHIGIGIASAINVLSPKMVIIGGTVINQFKDSIVPSIIESASKNALNDVFQGVSIALSTTENAAAKGAASLVLSSVFEEAGHYYA